MSFCESNLENAVNLSLVRNISGLKHENLGVFPLGIFGFECDPKKSNYFRIRVAGNSCRSDANERIYFLILICVVPLEVARRNINLRFQNAKSQDGASAVELLAEGTERKTQLNFCK